MLNIILGFLTLAFTTGEATKTLEVKAEKSTIIWNATKVTGAHTGTVALLDGQLDFDGKQLIGGSFKVDMTTLGATDLEGEWKTKLDGHLKSADFFDVENFKTASLKITNVKSLGKGKYDVIGDFTIKGKTESISFPVTVVEGQNATAKITINRAKFDIRYGSNSFFDNLGDKAIADDFTLDVTIAL
jgi:polyisoprenoid-binding protein YceI